MLLTSILDFVGERTIKEQMRTRVTSRIAERVKTINREPPFVKLIIGSKSAMKN